VPSQMDGTSFSLINSNPYWMVTSSKLNLFDYSCAKINISQFMPCTTSKSEQENDTLGGTTFAPPEPTSFQEV